MIPSVSLWRRMAHSLSALMIIVALLLGSSGILAQQPKQERGKIPMTEWRAPDGSKPTTYREWKAKHPDVKETKLEKKYETPPAAKSAGTTATAQSATTPRLVYVLINPSLYHSIVNRLFQWIGDVQQSGWSVSIYSGVFTSPEALRTHLASIPNLKQLFLIGDFPVPWYEVDYEQFPIDLFYMDLNGSWSDSDADGIYDTHTGAIVPEIGVGRLSASGGMFGRSEAELINSYLGRNHAYRTGVLRLPRNFLMYVDNDWAGAAEAWRSEIVGSYPRMTVVNDLDTTSRDDYLARLDDGWEWIQVHSHSYSGGQVLITSQGDGWIFSDEMFYLDPRSFFYNLYACSATRFIEPNYLGGAYLFNKSLSLAVLGSAKSGAMHGFNYFYGPFAQGQPLGEAFRNWFTSWGLSDQAWHYGMNLLGDPTLTEPTY